MKDTEIFKGKHCETSATGNLLKQIGIELSEPMLFGLGEGIGFIYWKMKTMPSPFLGGRTKPDVLTQNIVKHLNLRMEVKETGSIKKAWENLKGYIDKGIVTGVKLDMYYLDYFKENVHFAAHYVAMYKYDENYAYLIDTALGKVRTSLKSLELARNAKGPMSSPNRIYTIYRANEQFDLKKAVVEASKNNAIEYLSAPIQNFGYKGILKTSKEVKKWFNNSENIEEEFSFTAMMMEEAGTGGAIFRNIYRDFLKECYEITKESHFIKAYKLFVDIAEMWTEVATLFKKTSESKNVEFINKASEILNHLSEKEKKAMEFLCL